MMLPFNDLVKQASNWAYAYPSLSISAKLRESASDFVVAETLPYELTGNGEHVYLKITKQSLNTNDVISAISKLANIPKNRIGYAGLKDKHAITTQWFSVYITGYDEPDWQLLQNTQINIEQVTRHNKKLKIGSIKSNCFEIILRNIQNGQNKIDERLNLIKTSGVPNYFGEQRFGNHFNNIKNALAMLDGSKKVKNRSLRSIYISAVRSYLFNHVLSCRIKDKSWDTGIAGDAMALNGTRGFFVAENVDDEIIQRLLDGDIHPTGPLCGIGDSVVGEIVSEYESKKLALYEDIIDYLKQNNLKLARRALRAIPIDLNWRWVDDATVVLNFELNSGCFATSIIREVIDTSR